MPLRLLARRFFGFSAALWVGTELAPAVLPAYRN
jgi:hypothetical protein